MLAERHLNPDMSSGACGLDVAAAGPAQRRRERSQALPWTRATFSDKVERP